MGQARKRRIIALGAIGLLVGALASSEVAASTRSVARASDHDWARDAVRAGEIRSLAEILKRMEREFVGQVLEIELERDDGRIVYAVELLTPAGHVVELTYDARTGVLLETEGQGLDRARRQVRP
jgi:uncharacterized membrane protein YkoI